VKAQSDLICNQQQTPVRPSAAELPSRAADPVRPRQNLGRWCAQQSGRGNSPSGPAACSCTKPSARRPWLGGSKLEHPQAEVIAHTGMPAQPARSRRLHRSTAKLLARASGQRRPPVSSCYRARPSATKMPAPVPAQEFFMRCRVSTPAVAIACPYNAAEHAGEASG